MAADGFLNMLKPPGMTSHDVVAWARSQLSTKRIGHLGTLDPAAAGVLPLSLGRATRLFDHAAGTDKAYRAEIVFGVETDTLDAEGRVIASSDASALTGEGIRSLLPRFVGEIEQSPPAFSAVSEGGRRLHERARAGAPAAGRPRRVFVHQLDLVQFKPGRRALALIDVVCSAGTYIRAIADELGRAAGCGACLGFLVRLRAGRFELSDAWTLEEVRELGEAGKSHECFLPIDWPLSSLAELTLDATQALSFVRGNALRGVAPSPPAPDDLLRAYAPGRLFLGLCELRPDGTVQPRIVLLSEGELPV